MQNLANRQFLKKVQIFSDLPDSDLDILLKIVAERSYRKGEVVFHAEDSGSVLFFLKSGSVKISISDRKGKEAILKIISKGDFFGEMSILDDHHRSATVTAMEKCSALIIRRELFIDFIKKYPQIPLQMLATFCRRLRKTDEKIASLRFADAYGKVAKAILEIADENGTRKETGIEISRMPSRQDLADMAGVTRETATRVLIEFQKSGCLKVEGKTISILNEAMLRRELF